MNLSRRARLLLRLAMVLGLAVIYVPLLVVVLNSFNTSSYEHMKRSLDASMQFANVDVSEYKLTERERLLIGSKASFNAAYTIRDLTRGDIRPAQEFPVDPANEAG